MSTSYSVARSVSSGGHGIPWLFYVPAVLVGILATNDVIAVTASHPAKIEGAADVGLFVLLSFLWYFFLGRIPNLLLVRNIRQQVPLDSGVFGAQFLNAQGGQRGIVAQFGGSRPTALVVLATGLQVWAGSGDSVRPVKTWSWADLDEVSTAIGNPWSAVIDIRQKGWIAPVRVVLRSGNVFSTIQQRGRLRSKRVTELEGLRAAPGRP